MYLNKKILCIKPARKGSKGIVDKNIKQFVKKPLIEHTIKFATKLPLVDKIMVSTDDIRISEICKKYSVNFEKRPDELATDDSSMYDVLSYIVAMEKYKEYNVVVLLQPTSPLRKVNTVIKAIKEFVNNSNEYDSLMPLFKFDYKTGSIVENKYKKDFNVGNRQDLKEKYYECGTVFVYKVSSIITNSYYNHIYPFVIDSLYEAIDIDTEKEFKIAEIIKKELYGK